MKEYINKKVQISMTDQVIVGTVLGIDSLCNVIISQSDTSESQILFIRGDSLLYIGLLSYSIFICFLSNYNVDELNCDTLWKFICHPIVTSLPFRLRKCSNHQRNIEIRKKPFI
jgi:small nuclear ribonucleoprotein (snRNP)-like protein